MELWCHNEGTDVIKKKSLIPHEEYLLHAKFQFLSLVQFQNTEDQSF